MNQHYNGQKEKKDMKIIDFEKKGNTVRFALANRDSDYWGDDWDDSPYEDNAGPVYDRFVDKFVDLGFDLDTKVLEPCNSYGRSYSKEDMKERKIPCLIIAPESSLKQSELPEWEWDEFDSCLRAVVPNILMIYFGDSYKEVKERLDILKATEPECYLENGFSFSVLKQFDNIKKD